ncbi:hypothetical protein [Haloferula sp. BvORR071]|uniref:hypothetical protein n=1 Tax=Haloferula sp. BvORR071 TaxID=1396141 RepID=UPI00055319DE|nr:hypothetical protein [Haloferula sp. BvORR071]
MTEVVNLDDWNPSEETLRKWAYAENLALADQEEDLILQEEAYLPLLLELADDPACPKADYILSCLDHYLMFRVLLGKEEFDLAIVEKGAVLAGRATSGSIRDWGQLQQRRLEYRQGTGPVSRETALVMARDLLIGICRRADLSLVGERDDTWEIELSVPPENRHRERLSIDKQTGRFSFSRYGEDWGC